MPVDSEEVMPSNTGDQEVPKTRRQRRLAQERQALAKEAKIRKMLKKRPTAEEDARLIGTFGLFGRAVAKKCPKLFEKPWLGRMRMLEDRKSAWVRPIEKWKPKGKSPRTQFRSLVRHLLVKYDVPQFLVDSFMEEDKRTRNIGLRLLVHVGQGGSLYKAVKPRPDLVTEALLPVPLTKKMCREFLRQTSDQSLASAVRMAQVKVYGGSPRLARILARDTWLGMEINKEEEFWAHVIQWLCNQPMLNPHEIMPIFDWVAQQRRDNKAFSMKGRTGASVHRAVEEWHGRLAKLKGHRHVEFPSSGLKEGLFERKINLPGGGHHMEVWHIEEITNSTQLHAEGKKMRHCVYSYGRSVVNGQCSIWRLRVDNVRQLTIEVRTKTKQIVQIAGKFNRKATQQEMRYIDEWASQNGLTVRTYRW